MEIGARLKEAREAKKLSLDEIQKLTKIQTRYLQAIEKGDYHVMPGNFYVRAFIKEYATAVDLDPDLLMEEYSSELPASSDESAIQYTRVQRSRKDTTSSASPAILSFLPTIIAVLLIVGTAFAIWYFYQQSQSGNPNQPVETEENGGDEVRLPQEEEQIDSQIINGDDEQQEEPTSEEEETTSEEGTVTQEPELSLVEQGDGETTYELTHGGEQLLLELTSNNDHWLEIENGKGKSFYYDMFGPDDSPFTQDMTGEEQIYLRFGNPTQLQITIDGLPLKLPADIDPSQVQKVWINVVSDIE